MTELHRSSALIGFYGDDLDPDEVTAKLGAIPTVGVRKGGIWHTSQGAPKNAFTGSWRIESARREPADLDGQIAELLAPLNNDLTVWRDLASRYRAVIFCGLWLQEGNEGYEFKPETLLAAGERHLLLDLDIYAPE